MEGKLLDDVSISTATNLHQILNCGRGVVAEMSLVSSGQEVVDFEGVLS